MKKILNLTLIISLIAFLSFLCFEPQLSKAVADEITVTQDVSVEISISSPSNVTMSASIPGMTGGLATGSATWTVVTNNNTGFILKLASSTNPALAGATQGDSFADYTETVADTPDYDWTVAESDAEFGYTVEPATAADTVQAFLNAAGPAAPCNTVGGIETADKCWLDFAAAGLNVINRSSETTVSGEAEVIKFKAELNGPATDADGFLIEDSYTATITATATIN